MWKRSTISFSLRQLSSSSSTPEIPSLYSFLQPSIFALKPNPTPPISQQQQEETPSKSFNKSTQNTLSPDQITSLQSTLQTSLDTHDTDEAWKSFKTLLTTTTNSNFFSITTHLSNSLITHLSSLKNDNPNSNLNLKRAFAAVIFLLDKNPQSLSFETIGNLLQAMKSANAPPAPAFALIKAMFKNRFFPPFSLWGHLLVEISRKNGSFVDFLKVFNDNCKIALDEKLDFMRPDLVACNAALEGCCFDLESVSDADVVVETMSVLGVRPNELSFGFLAYLYALKGMEERVDELEKLMDGLGFSSKRVLFYSNLISGYVKSGNLDTISNVMLRCLREGDGKNSYFGEETYTQVVKGFLQHGNIKNLANVITEAQKLESSSIEIVNSVGFGIINASVNLGLLDKGHSIINEMKAERSFIGLGVYVSILKAYCKEFRTAEAAQLVTEISASGIQLDSTSYDSLIEASMSNQDFQSAFSLLRDMREARIPELQMSYLTIMTGLTENNRPELMAAFLDEVVEDPRIKVGTHDWNSIIHAFCKIGRMEDARRTFRRMVFLQFEPNGQTYLSLINGYVMVEKYFSVLMLWIEVVEKSQEMKIFVDKWRYKQAFMETHKKLKVAKLRKRNFRKMEALIAFKNWAGLSA